MEWEEKRELYWICCSSEENNVGDDMVGEIWDVCALDVPWLLVLVTADEVTIPFRFFDGSAIWENYSKFELVEMKEDEKDEFWALWDVIWLRIEGEIKFWRFRDFGFEFYGNRILVVSEISNL